MPPPKRKLTHVPVTLSINSKRRGKVEQKHINLFSEQNDATTSNREIPSTSTFDSNDVELQQPHSAAQNQTETKNKIYYDQRKKEIGAWQNERPGIITSLLERQAPICNVCSMCKKACESVVRCSQCSSTYVACLSCALQDHKLRPLHQLEMWNVCLLKYLSLLLGHNLSVSGVRLSVCPFISQLGK